MHARIADLQRGAQPRHSITRPAGNGRELFLVGWPLVPFWLKPGEAKLHEIRGWRPQHYNKISTRFGQLQSHLMALQMLAKIRGGS